MSNQLELEGKKTPGADEDFEAVARCRKGDVDC